MRAFVMLYARVGKGHRRRYESGRSSSSERRAFSLLSSVCCDWHQTLTGWPQSSTPHWVRHQIKNLIERKRKLCINRHGSAFYYNSNEYGFHYYANAVNKYSFNFRVDIAHISRAHPTVMAVMHAEKMANIAQFAENKKNFNLQSFYARK